MRKTPQSNLVNSGPLVVKTATTSFSVAAFFIDLDGTTLDRFNKKISKQNLQALQAKNQHYPVIISTGRPFSQTVKSLMQAIGSPYAICQNGAVIGNHRGEVLINIPLAKKQVEKLVQFCFKNNLAILINSQFKIFSNQKFWFWFKPFFWGKFKKLNQLNLDHYEQINKVVLMGQNPDKMHAHFEVLLAKFPDVSIKTSGHDRIIEITHKEATKGHGAILVADLLRIDVKKTVHIGDSGNDSSTANIVGALIAVANASSKLLDVATHIGPSYKNGGLAKILSGDFREIKR